MTFPFLRTLFFLLFISVTLNPPLFAADESPRERISLDPGWKFHLGDEWGLCEDLAKAAQSSGPAGIHFNDFDWRSVNLPHDWVVELPFDPQADYNHGYKPVGRAYPKNSIGWYRRSFLLTGADLGKRLSLEFDGVYRDCRVYVNGYVLAHHESGYNGFRCDITDVANYEGKNVVTLRVDASEYEGWFYEGAGIYRHVWLEKTSPVAVAPDGIFVYSTFQNNLPDGPSTVHVDTQVLNAQNTPATATVTSEILNSDEQAVAGMKEVETMAPWENRKFGRTAEVASPSLWSPESPKLYKLVTTIESGGKIVDREETRFGIRTLGFDTTNGFSLNGHPYPIKGACLHQDHAGVGSALPDALQTFRIMKLKEMGCNAIRTSHNEPTAELLDACDRVGMLVMDENRRCGSDDQNLAYLQQQIVRDRNHPSVFIWSLANEEHAIQQSEVGARIIATMQNLAHQLDPTRLCTAAMDGRANGKADGFSSVLDVQGFNYIHRGDMDVFHRSNPDIPCIGTEETSAYYTRGVYQNTATYKSAYDENKPDYGTTAEQWWNYYSARPWASGSFMWTGFDYRGEESPFRWPNISSEFGSVDLCGFPKDVFYYYKSWWTEKPVLHLMPHWTWPGREGQDIDVRCFSNCEEVELFLNGVSLGRQKMPKNSHLQWMVKYAPGTLSAKGYVNGEVVAEDKVETAGAPASVQLVPDRGTIQADGGDVSVVTVSATDAQGRPVPIANNLIYLQLSGPGKIIGVGNGDPACHEPDVYIPKNSVRSVSLDEGWRWKPVPNVHQNQPEFGTDYNDLSWETADVQSKQGQLQEHQQAVFRTSFAVTDKDLEGDAAELTFKQIDDDGFIYVNGVQVGKSHLREMPKSFDVKPFLHVGDNTIAVGVDNIGGPGGLTQGVTFDYQDQVPSPDWQRSLFNGLAEVLVQSTKDPGEIKLTAAAAGLSSADQVIESTAAKPGAPAGP
jgi:beta-galactosidase